MTANPTPTRRDLDAHDNANAVALDADAEAVLRRDLPEQVDVALAEVRSTVTTRFPPRDALRTLARAASPQAWTLYERSDRLYWCIVERNNGFLWQQARFHAKLSRMDAAEDVMPSVREAAFRAAVNWSPDAAAYTTYAQNWIRAAWRRANERQGAVDVGDSRAIRAVGGFGCVGVDSLDAPIGDDPAGATGLDMLADPADEPEVDAADIARLMALVDALDGRSAVVVRRWAEGAPLATIGAEIGVSGERVRQIHEAALGELRHKLGAEQHRAKIRAGVDAARAKGTHCGRPPVAVPAEAVAAVRNGAPVKATAKAFGVDHNTLRRRVQAEAAAPPLATPPDEVPPTPAPAPLAEALRMPEPVAKPTAPAPVAAPPDALPSVDALARIAREITEIQKLRQNAERARDLARKFDDEAAERWAALGIGVGGPS